MSRSLQFSKKLQVNWTWIIYITICNACFSVYLKPKTPNRQVMRIPIYQIMKVMELLMLVILKVLSIFWFSLLNIYAVNFWFAKYQNYSQNCGFFFHIKQLLFIYCYLKQILHYDIVALTLYSTFLWLWQGNVHKCVHDVIHTNIHRYTRIHTQTHTHKKQVNKIIEDNVNKTWWKEIK